MILLGGLPCPLPLSAGEVLAVGPSDSQAAMPRIKAMHHAGRYGREANIAQLLWGVRVEPVDGAGTRRIEIGRRFLTSPPEGPPCPSQTGDRQPSAATRLTQSA